MFFCLKIKVILGYNVPKVEIRNFYQKWKRNFHQSVKNDLRTYENVWKTSPTDDYTTGCLLDFNYFEEHYKLIAIY